LSGWRFPADQTEDDHDEADAAASAGALSNRPPQGVRITGSRRHVPHGKDMTASLLG
jgi:hypothetical protein